MNGRNWLRRGEYTLMYLTVIIIAYFCDPGTYENYLTQGEAIISILVNVMGIYFMFAFTVMRCRNMGVNPWWSLVIIIPFGVLWFMLVPGDDVTTVVKEDDNVLPS